MYSDQHIEEILFGNLPSEIQSRWGQEPPSMDFAVFSERGPYDLYERSVKDMHALDPASRNGGEPLDVMYPVGIPKHTAKSFHRLLGRNEMAMAHWSAVATIIDQWRITGPAWNLRTKICKYWYPVPDTGVCDLLGYPASICEHHEARM